MRNRLHVAIVAGLLFSLAGAKAAHATLADAQNHFLHGRYPEAEAEAKKLKGKDAAAGNLLLGRIQLRTGKYKVAEATFRAAAKSLKGKDALDAQVGIAEALRATGATAAARKELEAALAKDSTHLRARAIYGEVLEDMGEYAMAEAVFDKFYDDYNDGKIDDKQADQMMYVAIAAGHLGRFEDANDTYRTAVDLDANLLEANVRWGDLFMQKYSAGYAEMSFDEVLKVDPNHPDALVGMARVKLEQSLVDIEPLALCDKALTHNPVHAGALNVKAGILIRGAKYPEAKLVIAKALASNPSDLQALSNRAGLEFLLDDKAAFNATVKKTLALNAKYAELYHTVAEFLNRELRYPDAIPMEEAALKLRPEYYVAMAELASHHLRMGDEVRGRQLLDEAFKRDPFNVRAYNLLNLYEDILDKDYEFVDWPPASSKKPARFRLRVAKTERDVMIPRISPLLDQAFDAMVKRYGFTPQLPITIELYAEGEHYSVRSIGLPSLSPGFLAMCFGKVITAQSPHERSINWGLMLWHELGHVFAIQLSAWRVPRWFTEGLSEYETVITRKEWRRENDRDLWKALKLGKLTSVADLDPAFLDPATVQVAYHQSSVLVGWMAETWGMPKIAEGLKAWSKGVATPAVLKQITGLDSPAIDAAFRKYLAVKLKAYDGSYFIEREAYEDLEAREKFAKANPTDAGGHAALALAYLNAEDLDKAKLAAQAALKLDAKRKDALWVMGDVAVLEKKDLEAKSWLDKLVAAGGDGYDARGKLGLIAYRAKNLAEAEKQLAMAKRMNPEASEPYELLYQLYSELGQGDKALIEMEGYAWIENMDAKAFEILVLRHAEKSNWKKVVEFGEISNHINPWNGKVLERLGRAYNELGRADDAIRELSAATLLVNDDAPGEPARVQFELAKAYVKKKDKKRAQDALNKAIKLDPKNAEFKLLKIK